MFSSLHSQNVLDLSTVVFNQIYLELTQFNVSIKSLLAAHTGELRPSYINVFLLQKMRQYCDLGLLSSIYC